MSGRHRTARTLRPIGPVTALLALVLGLVAAPPAALASGASRFVTVTRLDDPAGSGSCTDAAADDCSLRQALAAVPDGGAVSVPAGTYVLTRGQLTVQDSLTLTGAGAKATTIQQSTAGARVLEIGGSGTVRIDDVTITGGSTTGDGGGIDVSGTASVTLERDQISGNTAGGDGGGVDAAGGALSMRQSTVSSNRAAEGGGIAGAPYASGDDDTIAANTATVAGGGLYSTANYSPDLTFYFSTIAANTAPLGSAVSEPASGGSPQLVFSAVSGTCARDSGSAAVTLSGYDDAVDDAGCVPPGSTSVAVASDLGLGALADNGGPTPTMLPAAGSPLIDDAFADSLTGYSGQPADVKAQIDAQCANYAVAGTSSGTPVDQRGGYRPGGAHCDIGAVEVFTDTTAPTWPAAAALTASKVGAVGLTLSWPQASDDTAVRAYRITGGSGTQTVDASLTSVALSHLAPLRTYHLAVVALDAAGNASPALHADVTTTAVAARPFVFSRGPAVGVAPSSLSGDLTLGLYETTAGGRTLTLTDTATGASRTVDSVGANPGYTNPAFPVISADGSTVAWRSVDVANGSTTDTIRVLTGFGADLTGGSIRTVQVTGNTLTGLALSGDGSRLFVDKSNAGTLVQLTGPDAGATYPVTLGPSDRETQVTLNSDGTRLLQVVGNGPVISAASVIDLSDPTNPTSRQLFADSLVDQISSVSVGQPFWPVAVSSDFSTISYREATSAAANTTQHATARVVVRSLDGTNPRYYGDTLPLAFSSYSGGWNPGSGPLSLDADGGTLLFTATDPDVNAVGAVSAYVASTSAGDTEQLVTRDDVGNPRAVTGAWIDASGDGVLAWIGPTYTQTYGDGGILAGDGDGQPDAGLFRSSSDTSPPTWPAGAALTADGVGTTQATLHWPAADDDKGVAGYVVTGAPATITAAAGATSTTVTGLTPGTTYHLAIVATDAAGNRSTPLTLDVTTAVTVTPGSAPLSLKADSDGTVSLVWDAAAGATGYRIQRAVVAGGTAGAFATVATVGASPVSWTDTSADGVTTYRYVVQKIVGGAPQPHTVTKDVTTVAVAVGSASANGSPTGGQLTYGSSVQVTVTGQPHRTGTATLNYSDASTPPMPHTATATLTETSTPGTYTARVPLPADAASVQSVTGTLTDSVGTGAGHTAAHSLAFAATVGGRLDITVPSASGFSGTLAISSDSAHFATSVPITASSGPETVSAYLPAAPDVVVRVLSAGGYTAQILSGISVGHGQVVARTTTTLDSASLTVHLGSDGANRRISLYTPLTGNVTYQADATGDVTITGLRAGDAGVLSVNPENDDLCGTVLPTNQAVQLAAGANSVSAPVSIPAAATLTGSVSTSDGSGPQYTVVTVTQSCDGQSRNHSVLADADGRYTVDRLSAGLATTVTAVAGDSYAVVSGDLGALPAGTEQHDLQLMATSTYDVSIALHTQLGSQAPVTVALGWQDLVHYATTVQVGNAAIVPWRPDGGTGTVRGVPGEALTLCADGAQGGYGAGCTTTHLPATGQPAALDLTLHAVAQLEVSPTLPASWTGDTRVGVVGSLECDPQPCTPAHTMSSAVYTGSQSVLALPAEGTWDFTFTSSGGADGTTAVAHRTIATGGGDADLGTVALTVGSSSFTGTDNSLTANAEQAVPGGTVQLTARWHATQAVSGTGTLELTVPRGTSVPATDAVTVDGSAPAGGYTVVDGVLHVPAGSIPTGVTRTASVILTIDTDQSALPPDGDLGFDAQLVAGSTTTDLGTVQVEVGAVSLDAPATTGSLEVPVAGRATPGSAVSVVENGATIGTAVTSPGGFWQTTVTLPDLGQGYEHPLIAQTGTGTDLQQSAPASVTFDKFQPALTTLTLSQAHGSVTVAAGTSFPYVVVPSAPLTVSTTVANPDTVSKPAFVLSGVSFPATRNGAVFSATLPTPDLHLLDANDIDFSYTPVLPSGTTSTDFAGPIPTATQARADAGTLGSYLGAPSVLIDTDAEKKVTAPLTNGVTGSSTSDITWQNVSSIPTSGLTQLMDGVQADTPDFENGIGPAASATSSGTMQVTGRVYFTGQAAAAAERAHHLVRPNAAPSAEAMAIYKLVFNVGSNGYDIYGALGSADKYRDLAKLRAKIGINCGSDQNALTSEANTIFAAAIAKDAVSIGLTIGGLVLAPETFGIGTVAMWVAGAVIDYAMDKALDIAIADLTSNVDAKCHQDIHGPGPDGPAPGTGNQNGGHPTPIWDPSGTVYDGPSTSPLAGATVTILRSDSANGPWQVWDADAYAQGPNPQHTAADGRYGWDVPVGWYKVSASASGHLSAESQPLPVLPPQTGIDLMLPSSAAPSLASAVPDADGTITLTFGTWMRAALLSGQQITVTNSAGKPVPATVTPIGVATSPTGDALTKTVRVAPTGLSASVPQVLHVRVASAVQDAAGRPLGSDATSTVTIRAKVLLTASASTSVRYGASTTLRAVLTAGSTPLAGQAVTLQQLPAGAKAWSTVKALRTDAKGALALAVRPTRTTRYRWSFTSTASYSGAVSATRTVTVVQTVSVAASPSRLRHSSRAVVRIYGVIGPSVTGEKVVVQELVRGSWRATRYTATTRGQRLPNGRTEVGYVIAVPERTRGTFTYRVARAATSTTAAGYSVSCRITVT